MKNKSYNCTITFAIAGFIFGLLLNVAGALLNYYATLKGPLFYFLNYSFVNIIIILSPVYLSIVLGFCGFVKMKLCTFNCIGKSIGQVNEAVIIINVNRVVQWANDGFVNTFGYSFKEIKGKDLSEILLGPISNKEIGNSMLSKLLKGEVAGGDLVIYHKNGQPIWISTSVTPIFDNRGEIEGYIAINKNINHQKVKDLSVDALYKEIADYKYALDQSSSVITFDLDGNIIKANTNFCIINELDSNKIIGRNFSLINTSFGNYSIAKPIWNALLQGLPWKGELINRNVNGKIFWAYTIIVPILNETGNPYQFLLIEKDITERILLENQLKINTYKLQMAMQIGLIGSWEIDINNIITLSDELRTIIKEPLNSPIDLAYLFERISPEDVEMIQKNLTSTRTTFQRNDMEFQFLVHGEIHYLATSNTAQFNKEGDFIGLFGTMQDVTAFKLIELALIKSQEEKAAAMQIGLVGSWELDINGIVTLSDELRTIIKEPLNSQIDLAYLFERISPEDVEMIQKKLTLTRTTFQRNDMEFQFLVHGEIYYLATSIIAQFNKEGDFTGLFGIMQDITSYKLIELALIKSQGEKAKAMEIAMLGSWAIDKDGVLTVSEELRKIYHLPLQGQITLLEVYNNIPSDDIEIIEERLSTTRSTFQQNDFEFRYFIDGKVHYMTSSSIAQFNKAGDFTGLFGTVQDITIVKSITLELKKSEEEKAVILNNTQAIISIHEMDGTIIYINKAAENMLGLTNQEAVGLNIKSFTDVSDVKIMDDYFINVHTSDKVSGKIHLITKTGDKRLCLYQNTIYANNGNNPYVIASAIDITSVAAKL